MLRRLFRCGAAIDDDLVQQRELSAKPVLSDEPLQIRRIVDEQFLDKAALIFPERNDVADALSYDPTA